MQREVMILKLTNGLDCVGELAGKVQDTDLNETVAYSFRKFRTIGYREIRQGEVAINFQIFFLPAEDADITIRDKDILCILPAPAKIEQAYIAAVSPIQLATAMPQGRIIEGKLN